jgi:DNA-binding GntR family transcriptional regulator
VLRILASRGLIGIEPNRGATVPRPGFDDVAETYAARRALGALIVHRTAESRSPNHLRLLKSAVKDMLDISKTGDAWATGDADLRFQDLMADMTGMRRVPVMFSSLTDQLRLFVAVIGLRYAYSIPAMCRDNTALLRSIADHNPAEALRLWNSKMDDAAAYMIHQLDSLQSRRA